MYLSVHTCYSKLAHAWFRKFPNPVQKLVVDCAFARAIGWLSPESPPFCFVIDYGSTAKIIFCD